MDINLATSLINDRKLIFSYIRNPTTNKKVGMLVAWKAEEVVQISYSLVNPGDKFDRMQGILEASNKIFDDSYLLSENKIVQIDHELTLSFLRRTIQYFKTSNICIHLPILKRISHAKASSES
jgi:hypothetical protein